MDGIKQDILEETLFPDNTPTVIAIKCKNEDHSASLQKGGIRAEDAAGEVSVDWVCTDQEVEGWSRKGFTPGPEWGPSWDSWGVLEGSGGELFKWTTKITSAVAFCRLYINRKCDFHLTTN